MKSDKFLKENNLELYKVARQKDTEKAFTGKYVETKDSGTYHCAVCDNKLFSSETKFDSGSGWPSFTDPVNLENVILTKDKTLGISRTEVSCKKCGAHLGHVFNDGPIKDNKTCDRFCINSVSLNFNKRADVVKK